MGSIWTFGRHYLYSTQSQDFGQELCIARGLYFTNYTSKLADLVQRASMSKLISFKLRRKILLVVEKISTNFTGNIWRNKVTLIYK